MPKNQFTLAEMAAIEHIKRLMENAPNAFTESLLGKACGALLRENATAPGLYDALAELHDASVSLPVGNDVVTHVRAALAKARGEQSITPAVPYLQEITPATSRCGHNFAIPSCPYERCAAREIYEALNVFMDLTWAGEAEITTAEELKGRAALALAKGAASDAL